MVRSGCSYRSCSKRSTKSKNSTNIEKTLKKNITLKKKSIEKSKSFFERIRNGVTDISRSVGRLAKLGQRNSSAISVTSKNSESKSNYKSKRNSQKKSNVTTPRRSKRISSMSKTNRDRSPSRCQSKRKRSPVRNRTHSAVTTRSAPRQLPTIKHSTNSENKLDVIPSLEVNTDHYISEIPKSYKTVSYASSIKSRNSSIKTSRSKKSKTRSRKNSRNSIHKSKNNLKNQETDDTNKSMSPVGMMRRMVSASVNSIAGNLMSSSSSPTIENNERDNMINSKHTVKSHKNNLKKRKNATMKRRSRSAMVKRNRYTLQATDSELDVREKRVDKLIKEFDGATTNFLYSGLLAPEVPKPAFLFYVNEQRDKRRAVLSAEAAGAIPRMHRKELDSQDEAVIIANDWSKMGKIERTPYLDLERDDRSRHQLQTLTYHTELNKARQIDGRRRS